MDLVSLPSSIDQILNLGFFRKCLGFCWTYHNGFPLIRKLLSSIYGVLSLSLIIREYLCMFNSR